MIQRIQSVYLLLTSILMALMLAMPLGRMLGGDTELVLGAFGIEHGATGEVVLENMLLGILIVVAAFLAFLNIFLYKYRILQLRLCLVQIIVMLAAGAYVALLLMRRVGELQSLRVEAAAFSIADVFPIVGIVFTWLAARAIRRDEALVRSLDRIR